MAETTTATRRLSAAEYFETTTEGDRTHLVDGRLVVNEPSNRHGLIQATLLRELGNWTAGAPGRGLVLPPVDVVLDDLNVYGPDLVWIPPEHLPVPSGRLAQLPALAAEIRSPGTWRYDVGTKKATYERRGLRELWLVDDRAEAILVFRRSAPAAPAFDVALELSGTDGLTSPLLPGFELPVAAVFGDGSQVRRG